MTLQPPDELMVEEFLPSVRLLVARELRRQGFSQSRIASVLGVTQASVSLYLSSSPGKAYSSMGALHISREEADRYAALLADDAKRSAAYAVETLGSIWLSILGRGLACDAHRRSYPSLENCDVCMRAYGNHSDKGGDALSEVAQAVKAIESSAAFVRVMPEVSVNLACVSGDSGLPEDVVAIPGRIVKVRDSAKATRQPEFGASGHMANMLLLVRTRRKDYRAAINLRYDRRMAAALKKLGLKTLEIEDHSESEARDSTVDALARRLAEVRAAFDAVADHGGRGIEPNVYLFGKSATEVVDSALKLATAYSAH